MKNEFLLVSTVFFIAIFVPFASALSIGISPSQKSIEIKEGETGIVYFAISQGSTETENIEITSDADWLSVDTPKFELEPMGQKYVKFTISSLPIGNYNAKIKTSSSIVGVAGMKSSVTANLLVTVVPPQESETGEPEIDEKTKADESISTAQNAIQNLRKIGGNTATPETILTRALEQYDQGNYVVAKNFADFALDLANEEYNKANMQKSILNSSMFATLIVGIGSAVLIVLLVFEIVKLKRTKEKIKIPGIKCPKCGETTNLVFDGTLTLCYKCPNCGYEEVDFKSMSTSK